MLSYMTILAEVRFLKNAFINAKALLNFVLLIFIANNYFKSQDPISYGNKLANLSKVYFKKIGYEFLLVFRF